MDNNYLNHVLGSPFINKEIKESIRNKISSLRNANNTIRMLQENAGAVDPITEFLQDQFNNNAHYIYAVLRDFKDKLSKDALPNEEKEIYELMEKVLNQFANILNIQPPQTTTNTNTTSEGLNITEARNTRPKEIQRAIDTKDNSTILIAYVKHVLKWMAGVINSAAKRFKQPHANIISYFPSAWIPLLQAINGLKSKFKPYEQKIKPNATATANTTQSQQQQQTARGGNPATQQQQQQQPQQQPQQQQQPPKQLTLDDFKFKEQDNEIIVSAKNSGEMGTSEGDRIVFDTGDFYTYDDMLELGLFSKSELDNKIKATAPALINLIPTDSGTKIENPDPKISPGNDKVKAEELAIIIDHMINIVISTVKADSLRSSKYLNKNNPLNEEVMVKSTSILEVDTPSGTGTQPDKEDIIKNAFIYNYQSKLNKSANFIIELDKGKQEDKTFELNGILHTLEVLWTTQDSNFNYLSVEVKNTLDNSLRESTIFLIPDNRVSPKYRGGGLKDFSFEEFFKRANPSAYTNPFEFWNFDGKKEDFYRALYAVIAHKPKEFRSKARYEKELTIDPNEKTQVISTERSKHKGVPLYKKITKQMLTKYINNKDEAEANRWILPLERIGYFKINPDMVRSEYMREKNFQALRTWLLYFSFTNDSATSIVNDFWIKKVSDNKDPASEPLDTLRQELEDFYKEVSGKRLRIQKKVKESFSYTKEKIINPFQLSNFI